MNRRTFLKIAATGSVAFAAGCTSDPENTLFTLVQAPDDMVTGEPNWYASTCRECPAGCGILAKNREGRVIKLEGNPLHPVNRGALCMRGQAALQGVYHPDRIQTPLLKENGQWRPLSYEKALLLLKRKAENAAAEGPDRVHLLTETVGDTRMSLFETAMSQLKSPGPLVFEPYAYESLKTANEKVFGIDGLPSYDLQSADLLVSFGADFLETWLSPVAYARRFKAMHAIKNNRKPLFIHISPHQSLTAANADVWIPCQPGTEPLIVFGLIREVLDRAQAPSAEASFRTFMKARMQPFSKDRVTAESGISRERFDMLADRLARSKTPLVLGTGTTFSGGNALKTNTGVNLLNRILDPDLACIDFHRRHRVEKAARRAAVQDLFQDLADGPARLLLLNHVDPQYAMPTFPGIRKAFDNPALFSVSFASFMDDTSRMADLVFPVRLPLETWDEYAGYTDAVSTLQPAMGCLTRAPDIGDVFMDALCVKERPAANYKQYLISRFEKGGSIHDERDWLRAISTGGLFPAPTRDRAVPKPVRLEKIADDFDWPAESNPQALLFSAVPAIRFYDGRGANLPWLCEAPDPLTQIAWQTPVVAHPKTLQTYDLKRGDLIRIVFGQETLDAPVYDWEGVVPGMLTMGIGQGHRDYGRYARETGLNPLSLLPAAIDPASGGPASWAGPVTIKKTGRNMKLANTDGSRSQHGRKIAMSVAIHDLRQGARDDHDGLTMHDFPLTLPLPEGYDGGRDFYPAHDHAGYRWAMVVDLDRCIGCGACSVACYAENNIGVVGETRILQGREMSWIRIERYLDPLYPADVTFLPMLCQHCDNAPCESVCPVYAPHHSKEGTNNQIYNRCIGTRFCAQNCPYKVRRFNWFTWQWPEPLNLQLNPNVTVRSKGVMEKCSFCIQRIKSAHSIAKNEQRGIRDGEVVPACVQTCPTRALTFGNLMDRQSRVRKLVEDPRAYQVMGYLNTKPAVIYLKKVVQDIQA